MLFGSRELAWMVRLLNEGHRARFLIETHSGKLVDAS